MTANGRAAGPAEPEIPVQLLLRRDRSIRFERGGKVYATDGFFGNLRQVIVARASGEVTALAINVAGSPRTILVSPELVDRTAGSAVFLLFDRARVLAGATEYDKRRFGKVNLKAILSAARGAAGGDPRRRVARVGRHFVELPSHTRPERSLREPASRPEGVPEPRLASG